MTRGLAGNAPEESIPLRPPDFYREQGIALKLGARAVAIDPTREVRLADGTRARYLSAPVLSVPRSGVIADARARGARRGA
jgi:NAD(P)H-nitrite reductase large subunit